LLSVNRLRPSKTPATASPGSIAATRSPALRTQWTLALLACTCLSSPVWAHDDTWTGTFNTQWTDVRNWFGEAVPDNTATFTNNGAPTTVNIATTTSINVMSFTAAAPAYSFTVGGTAVFTIADHIDNSSSFGPAFNVAAGATLATGAGKSVEIGSLTGSGSVIIGFSDATSALVVSGSSVSSFSGSLGGAGSLTKAGTGTLTLSGNNSYSGGTSLTVGTLAVGSSTALGTGALSFSNGTTLQAAANGLTLGNAMTLSGNNTVDTQANALTLGGAITGGSGSTLTKIGSGTLTLSRNNSATFAGGVFINGGTLAVGANNALGTGAVTLANGTALQAAATVTLDNAMTLNGTGTVDTNGNALTLVGALGGGGALNKIGAGTLTLDGTANGYTGATTVSGGTLALANFADISSSSVVTVKGGATFDISNNGGFTGISTLAGGGTVQLGGNGLVILNGSTEFSGVINGSAGLTIVGTQTLSGVNTYTNQTQINPGSTLALKGNGSIANSNLVDLVSASATFDISQTNAGTSVAGLFGNGRVSLGSKTLTITNGSFFNGVIQDGGIAGGSGGGLVIAAPGGQDLQGVNTYTGATTIVAGGLLTLSNNGSIASSSGLTLSGAGAQFDISAANGNVTIKDLSGVAGSTIQLGSNFLTVGTANSTTFAGVLDDSSNPGGGLIKQGSGTLTLIANNTFSGGTTVNAGLINFNSANNFGTGAITLNGGGLQWAAGTTTDISPMLAPLGAAGGTFDTNGNNVTLASTISGAGALTKQGVGTLTLTASNTYSGGTVVTGGLINFNAASNFGSGMVTLNGGGLQWAAGSSADISAKLAPLGAGGGTFDTNGNTVTFATGLTGTGGLAKQGLGKLNLTGNSTYTGGTAVLAGTLAINGSVAGNVAVGSAGTLGGNGTIFGSVVNAGTLVPGNSIGLLTVNGSYVQAAGSIYQVEVNNAGQGDRINVGGAAAIQGGTVQVQAAAGSYANSTTYTIVRAAGGVSGTYAGVSSNFAFLTPTLSYDANDVFLTLGLGQTAFTPTFLALTPNQKAVGTSLNQSFANASGDFATVIGALAGLNIAQGPVALDAISGQPYADFGTMNTNNAALFMNALGQQMANARGSSASTGQRQAMAQACEIESCDGTGPLSAWASALGGLGSVLGDSNASSLTYNFGGAAAGLDYRFDPRFLAGIGVGYTHGTQWVNTFMGQGWSDSVSVAAYGSFTQAGFYVDALAGYAYYGNQLQRQILIPGLQQRTATGSTGANQFLGQVEGGYKLGVYAPAAATITPFGRFQISSVTQNAFSESGAQSLSLNVAQQTTNSQRTTIGADLASSIRLGDERKLDFAVRLGWMHEFADVARPITAAFAGAPGNSFTVFGATPLRNAAVVGLQATTNIAAATQIYLRYDGEIATGTDNHAINIGVRMSW
jgi:outer membrane autotransporter protein